MCENLLVKTKVNGLTSSLTEKWEDATPKTEDASASNAKPSFRLFISPWTLSGFNGHSSQHLLVGT